MSDKRKEQIEGLKFTALATTDESTRLNLIDALEQYGEDAIDSIQTIIDSTINTNIKNRGLYAITRIKLKGNNEAKDWKIEGQISADED